MSIDVSAWKAARPAARLVRRRATALAILAAAAGAAGAVALDSLVLLLVVPFATGWAGWRAARHLLASRATRGVRGSGGLSPVALSELLARGTTVVRGATWVAVEDDRSVVLTTRAGPGPGQQLPLSVITQLGGSGAG